MTSAERQIRSLLSSLHRGVESTLEPAPELLFDWDAALATYSRFKLDVSFATHFEGVRFSVNDKGETGEFRERISQQRDGLGIDPQGLARFLESSPAGEVQLTLGLKWARAGGKPARTSLYFEELDRSPRGPALITEVPKAFGISLSPIGIDATPAAICVDWERRKPCAIKEYWMIEERGASPSVRLPAALETFRATFPLDPQRATRRYLIARRLNMTGVTLGHKLLWQSQAHDRAAAKRAWRRVDDLSATWGRIDALNALRTCIGDGDAFLYPDLVGLNTDGEGRPEGWVIYVSIK